MIELSETCICVVLKSNIFVFVSIAWSYPVIVPPSTFSKGNFFVITTLKNSQRLFLWVFSFNYVLSKLFAKWVTFTFLKYRCFFFQWCLCFKRPVYLYSDAWTNRSLACSINVTNVSTGISTTSEDSFWTSSNQFQSCSWTHNL